jgi:hypothetical protein
MKRLILVAISLALTFGLMPIGQAAAKTFKNCTELNKVYPGGVALPGAVDSGGKTKKTPKYNKALYISNKNRTEIKTG